MLQINTISPYFRATSLSSGNALCRMSLQGISLQDVLTSEPPVIAMCWRLIRFNVLLGLCLLIFGHSRTNSAHLLWHTYSCKIPLYAGRNTAGKPFGMGSIFKFSSGLNCPTKLCGAGCLYLLIINFHTYGRSRMFLYFLLWIDFWLGVCL